MKGVTMSEKCEMLESCGFFANYKGNTETIKEGWIKMFCHDRARSEFCERKKHRKRTGEPPADNMSPSGRFLL
jgi:hypothetical protein